MTMYWIYDIPVWAFWLLTVGTTCAVGVGGMLATRGWVSRFHRQHPHNEVVSYFLTEVGVLYGIMLGLIAVGTWQNYADTESKVTMESASLAALYRDVSNYADPARTSLQNGLREYTRYVIDQAWPLQREGVIPSGGSDRLTTFFAKLAQFEPATEGQRDLHREALSEFNRLSELRRLRLLSVNTGLPRTLWVLIVVGACINLAVTWFFEFKRLAVHFWMTFLMSLLLGLMIHLLADMDNPYRGGYSVSSESFQLDYDQLMK
jgi:hypothetical protein